MCKYIILLLSLGILSGCVDELQTVQVATINYKYVDKDNDLINKRLFVELIDNDFNSKTTCKSISKELNKKYDIKSINCHNDTVYFQPDEPRPIYIDQTW